MKISELIAKLNKIKNKNRKVVIVSGVEYSNLCSPDELLKEVFTVNDGFNDRWSKDYLFLKGEGKNYM